MEDEICHILILCSTIMLHYLMCVVVGENEPVWTLIMLQNTGNWSPLIGAGLSDLTVYSAPEIDFHLMVFT